MSRLEGRNILLGVSGGIAAYKTPDLVRLLVGRGARVQTAMTASAQRFVSPLVLTTLSGRKSWIDLFEPAPDDAGGSLIEHTGLATWGHALVIAPASANLIARLAAGMADDPVTLLASAFRGPTLICPSMNTAMWEHPAVQFNLETLEDYGYEILPPESGELACGVVGEGRLPDREAIALALEGLLSPQDLAGARVLVTAGPTREAIDPMRFISNRSSGRMGWELALEARRRGARVTLVAGPVAAPNPPGVETTRVESASQMRQAVMKIASEFDVIVMNAAVADFRPTQSAAAKLKKSGMGDALALSPNPDILAELGARKRGGQILVGFAAETGENQAEAARKLNAKRLDMIVLNPIEVAVETDRNQATLLFAEGRKEALGPLSKEATAMRIWDAVVAARRARQPSSGKRKSSKAK